MHHSTFTRRPWLQPLTTPHKLVGMLGQGEAAMFHAMAKEVFTGHGTIIDAGSFLGKSAYFLASGLRANPMFVAGRDKVHCFDVFQVNHGSTVEFFKRYLGLATRMGESTRAIFEQQVAPVRDLLEVHEGDLHTMAWKSQPIEILMIDIAKSESLGSRVVELFFPDLIPSVSYVIHQDYHHPWHPHIHVGMTYLADCFDLVAPRVDSSATFAMTKAIPAAALQRVIRYDFTRDEQLELMDAALVRLPESDRHIVELVRMVLRSKFFDDDQVLTELEDIRQRYSHLAGDPTWMREFSHVRDHFVERDGWRQNRLGRFDLSLQRAEELMAHNRSGASVQRLRGVSFRGLGRWTEAEDALRASLDQNPRSGFSYIELASLLAARGRLDEAESEIVQGLHDPAASDALPRQFLEGLGNIWWQHAGVDRANSVMDRLRASLENEPEYWVLDARLRVHVGQRQQGLISLRRAVECGLPASRRPEIDKQLGIASHEWDVA